jgi:hypothetical protein
MHMKVATNVKSVQWGNHSETASGSGLKVRTSVKAGGIDGCNHSEAASTAGLKVRTSVKAGAGGWGSNHNEKGLRRAARS